MFMKILFVGPQGSGKGTQAKIISKKLGIAHLSMGDLLRATKGMLREKVDSFINKGELVPTELTIEIIKKRIKESDCKNGFILDGFPRNLEQAEIVDSFIEIEKVFEIDISDDEAVKRLNKRWMCKNCNIGYNVLTSPKPKKQGICDKCGSPLYQREDDKDVEAIKNRLKIYHKETELILKRYKDKVIKINGEQTIEKITEDILTKLRS